jgi:hypothetical protein
VAYTGRDNSPRVVDGKSYFDSRGVALRAFGSDAKNAERYKLFADDKLRIVIFDRLWLQFAELARVVQIRRSNSASHFRLSRLLAPGTGESGRGTARSQELIGRFSH